MNLQNSSLVRNNILSNIFKGLLLSVILLYFSSCVEEDSIGSSFQDEGILLSTFFSDTFTVETSVVYVDSVVTSGNLLAGTENDDKFGQTTTESFFKLFIPNEYDTSFTGANNQAVFDSAELILSYALLSGDGSVAQDFELLPLNALINDTILYNQTDRIEVDTETSYGIETLTPDEDSLNVLRINSEQLGELLFQNRTSSNLQEQALFEQNIFKGFNLKPTDASLDAYTIRFAPTSSTSANFLFRVYFSLPGDTVSSIQNFFIGTSFYHAEADFSSSTFLSGLERGNKRSTESTGNEGYLQAGVGISTILQFPSLASFAAENPNVAINRAELSFDPVENSQELHGLPPSGLAFFVLDENGEFDDNVLLLQEGTTTNPVTTQIVQNTPILTLDYGLGSGTYPVADITSYVQGIVSGQQQNNGLMINPFLSRGSIARCIFGDNKFDNEKLQLRIYYTKNAPRN